jgi:tetratricopeptide (TPR) repeat protein
MALVRTVLLTAALSAAVALAAGVAQARAGIFDFWDKDVKNCASTNPDVAIAACTSRIQNLFERADGKAVALNNRAHAYILKGDYPKALADLNRAIGLRPTSYLAFYNRGVVYADGLAMPDRAIGDFTQAVALKQAAAPKGAPAAGAYPEALNSRGLAHLTLAQYGPAIADFTAALKLDPKFGAALANRGSALAAQRDYSAALSDQTAAIALDKTAPTRWAARCWTRLKIAARTGPPNVPALQGAQSDCAKALTLDGANLEARNGHGVINLMLNEPSLALADFQAVRVVDAKNGVALFGCGYAKRQLGDSAGGETDMAAARTLGPTAAVAFWDAKIIPNP